MKLVRDKDKLQEKNQKISDQKAEEAITNNNSVDRGRPRT